MRAGREPATVRVLSVNSRRPMPKVTKSAPATSWNSRTLPTRLGRCHCLRLVLTNIHHREHPELSHARLATGRRSEDVPNNLGALQTSAGGWDSCDDLVSAVLLVEMIHTLPALCFRRVVTNSERVRLEFVVSGPRDVIATRHTRDCRLLRERTMTDLREPSPTRHWCVDARLLAWAGDSRHRHW